MWNYSEKVYEHFRNPRNVGEIENPDAVGEVGSIVCGDVLKLTLKIDKQTERILDAKFKTFGCTSAIASSSVLTEMIIGKTINEAAKITNKDIVEYLGGLPKQKIHCSVMGAEALEAAIKNYRGEKLEKIYVGEGEKIVCECFQVTDTKILKAIQNNNLKTVEDVTNFTKAGGGCGKCKGEIEKILKDFWAQTGRKAFADMTIVEKVKQVENILGEVINPKLKGDGGWIELVDIEGMKIKLRFLGMCAGCPFAGDTLKNLVERELKRKLGQNISIEAE